MSDINRAIARYEDDMMADNRKPVREIIAQAIGKHANASRDGLVDAILSALAEHGYKVLGREPTKDRREKMKLVILESPYSGDIDANVEYARKAARHATLLGESPLLSHLFFTQFLDDNIPEERQLGIKAGLAWGRVADYRVMYMDRGLSNGMKLGLTDALLNNAQIHVRWIEREAEITHKELVDLFGVVNMNALSSWKVYRCP